MREYGVTSRLSTRLAVSRKVASRSCSPKMSLDHYADLRITSAIDRQFLDLTQRVASMSPESLGRLRLQLIAFFTRFDATSELQKLSVRDE